MKYFNELNIIKNYIKKVNEQLDGFEQAVIFLMPKWFQFLGWIFILSALLYVADLTKSSLVYVTFFISLMLLFASVYGVIFAIVSSIPLPDNLSDKATFIALIILLLGSPLLAYIIITLIAVVISALTVQFNPNCLC